MLCEDLGTAAGPLVLLLPQVLKLSHAAEKHFDYRTHHEILMGEAYEVRSCSRAVAKAVAIRAQHGDWSLK